eukprot:622029-Amphidinium_carterae.1
MTHQGMLSRADSSSTSKPSSDGGQDKSSCQGRCAFSNASHKENSTLSFNSTARVKHGEAKEI